MRLTAALKKVLLGIEEPADGIHGEVKAVDEKEWRVRDIFWWPVETEELAKRAVFVCLIFTCYFAYTWSISSITGFFSHSAQGYFNVITDFIAAIFFPMIMILVAWGLIKIKRVAAIVGFSFFFFQFVTSSYRIITDSASARWETSTLFRSVFLAFIFIQGFRGVSSYQRLRQNKIASPIIEN